MQKTISVCNSILYLKCLLLQSCAKELEWSLFQDSGRTVHSAEKNDTSYKRARFFTEMKQKENQNGRLRKFKMAASKKPRFPAPPILNIFSWNFYGLVLGPKNTKNTFFACFCAYVGQPHDHIKWDKSMPFTSINSTNPRTKP